jgi:anhydro-N-acetylmuramic acid kinase
MRRSDSRKRNCYVGLISGTSMDGIDAVVVDFSSHRPRLLAAATLPFDDGLRVELDHLRADPDHFPAAELARLDARLGRTLAEAAITIIDQADLSPADISAIGSHGQTVLHRPDDPWPHTLQIGDAHHLAQRTGIVTVADFRRADLAAGGQGAPLAPLLHQALFADNDQTRAVLNLGGIANITVLRGDRSVSGFDTGPANCLLDDWFRRYHDERFDGGGHWAASGQVDQGWLRTLLDDPYFSRPAPKSTGIEYFGRQWLDQRLPSWATSRPADVQATLAELTARSVASALSIEPDVSIDQVLVCGGGVHNDDLLERIRQALPNTPVASTADEGIDPDFVEAVLFAWLAKQRLDGRRLDTRPITGASTPVFAGTIHEPGESN